MGNYQKITDKIIEKLKKVDADEWQETFPTIQGRPQNPHSGTIYSGINVMLLWLSSYEQEFDDPRWVTYKQAEKLNGHVCKGESGTKIVYFNFVETTEEVENEDGEIVEETKTIPLCKTYTVFNVEQCEGIEIDEINSNPLTDEQKIEKCEMIVRALDVDIKVTDKVPGYHSQKDQIRMPEFSEALDPEKYYSTLFHELTHWTGHVSRLDRGLNGSRYNEEEIVATLGSAFICAEIGINNELKRDARYIKNWIDVLEEDQYAIFRASRQAKEAVEFIKENGEIELNENETEEKAA